MRNLIFKKSLSDINDSMAKSRSQNCWKMLLIQIYAERESRMQEAFCKYLYMLSLISIYLIFFCLIKVWKKKKINLLSEYVYQYLYGRSFPEDSLGEVWKPYGDAQCRKKAVLGMLPALPPSALCTITVHCTAALWLLYMYLLNYSHYSLRSKVLLFHIIKSFALVRPKSVSNPKTQDPLNLSDQ